MTGVRHTTGNDMLWLQVLEHLAVIAASAVAIFGIRAWRREHVGKRQVELAEDTLALFYQAADAIRYIRSSVGFGYETEGVERIEGESDKDFEARKRASFVFYRYNEYQEVFNKLHASRYRFMAQIGKDNAKPFDDIRGITHKILVSARRLPKLWARDHFRTEAEEKEQWDRIGRHEAVIWDGLEDDDPISSELDKVMSEIETTCRRVIEGGAPLWSLLSKRS